MKYSKMSESFDAQNPDGRNFGIRNIDIQSVGFEKRLRFVFIILTMIFMIVLTACGEENDGGKNSGTVGNSPVITTTPVSTSTPVNTSQQDESESTQIAEASTEKSTEAGDETSQPNPVSTEDMSNISNTPPADIRPGLVIVGKDLYTDTGYINSMMKCGTPDGVAVSKDENVEGEYDYQRSEGMHISVRIQDKWYLYVNVISSNNEIPSVVANFKAEVINASEDKLLVKVTEIPDDFSRIFGGKGTDEIKPMFLSTERLIVSKEERDEVLKNIKGKTVRVWFDGILKNTELELSSPAEPGEVYRIFIEN